MTSLHKMIGTVVVSLGVAAYVAAGVRWISVGNVLFSNELAAWVQALGSIGAILAAGWAAGVPVRAQRRERGLEQGARLMAMREAADTLLASRQCYAEALLEGQAEKFEKAAAKLDSSDHEFASAILQTPATEWPSIRLFGALQRVQRASANLDEAGANASYAVMRSNSHMSFPRARALLDSQIDFEETWADVAPLSLAKARPVHTGQ